VEGELRRIAHHYMRMERQDHTLQTTALVNEAYLKLVDQAQVDWQNRAQFLGVAARLMRHILVDHARELCRGKRAAERTFSRWTKAWSFRREIGGAGGAGRRAQRTGRTSTRARRRWSNSVTSAA
jgi:RNA polymerase sigma-70 factor, ECF subfamily